MIYNYDSWKDHKKGYPLFTITEYSKTFSKSNELNFVEVFSHELKSKNLDLIKNDKTIVLIIKTDNTNGVAEQRKIFIDLINSNISTPVVISRDYENISSEEIQLNCASDIGALLLDGLGDGISIEYDVKGSSKHINSTAFGILQASRTRISKTEYISCPSCGRTLFDLQETTAKIRKVTDHLKGVKIGIMGCIVNGPGEMADADYGYVGTKPGKITLYKERDVVKKNINEADAVDALIELIKEHGDWVEKKK